MANITEEKTADFGIKTEEMAEAGLHLGHKTSKCHPKMKPYLSGTRNNINIIDLDKSAAKLAEAIAFMKETVKSGKILLVVGTKIQHKALTKEFGVECGLPYISERWLGGTFTNFKTIKKRIDYFKDLQKKKETGELDKYTKKERLLFDRELKNMEIKFGGIKSLEKIPDAIFVLDMNRDMLAVKEAKKKGAKVVAVSDTNTNPTLVDYPIPANDETIAAARYILNRIKEAIK